MSSSGLISLAMLLLPEHFKWLQWTLTKIIAVVVPAFITSVLLLVQTLFSIFIIFLPEIFILQNLVSSIY